MFYKHHPPKDLLGCIAPDGFHDSTLAELPNPVREARSLGLCAQSFEGSSCGCHGCGNSCRGRTFERHRLLKQSFDAPIDAPISFDNLTRDLSRGPFSQSPINVFGEATEGQHLSWVREGNRDISSSTQLSAFSGTASEWTTFGLAAGEHKMPCTIEHCNELGKDLEDHLARNEELEAARDEACSGDWNDPAVLTACQQAFLAWNANQYDMADVVAAMSNCFDIARGYRPPGCLNS